jgi:hypothetical protein
MRIGSGFGRVAGCDAEACRLGCRLVSRGRVEFGEDGGDVVVDCLFGDEESAGDFGVAKAVGEVA